MSGCVCAAPVADKPDLSQLVADAEQEKKTRSKKAPVDDAVGKPLIHQIIRWISKTGSPNQNADPLDWINSYIGSYLEEGYKLLNTHYLGENPEAYGMMYVLVLEK